MAMGIWPLELCLSLCREEERSRLLIAVLPKVWAAVENVSYMRVGEAWFCRLYCCGGFLSK